MEDLIACLYPHDDGIQGYAGQAVLLPQNHSRYLRASEKAPELPGRNSRESTAPLENEDADAGTRTDQQDDTAHDHGLQLTFTHGPKAGPGFLLGTDANRCDIVLPPLPAISRQHCYLTFDSERRLIVRDHSTKGTTVRYDLQGDQRRRNFTWILGGHEVLNKSFRTIVLQVDVNLKFRVVVSTPSFPDMFFKNVDKFMANAASTATIPLATLGIQSNPSTAGRSRTYTPSQEPILLELEKLGEGSFSTVLRVLDVSTGFQYASKKFRSLTISDWKKEAFLMRQISHEHMVQLYFVIEKPPQLILEYLPLGNLHQHQQQPILEDEVISTLQQALSALTYLHEQCPPIVHRDIKPENILVSSRAPFQTKLGDFGLSKASESLRTFCGTPKYLAPELARYMESHSTPEAELRYTPAVDIWSLGVVILEYLYGLPLSNSGVGLRWCQAVVNSLHKCQSNGLIDILLDMVVMDPRARKPARTCLDRALQLSYSRRPSTPKQTQPRAGSIVPTEEFPNEELRKLRSGRLVTTSARDPSQATVKPARTRATSKRQRSSEEQSDQNRRNPAISLQNICSIPSGSPAHETVLQLLRDIQSADHDGKIDSRTPALIETLCNHLHRLKISQLKIQNKPATEQTTIMSQGFTIATFPSSILAQSISELAEYFVRILELMSFESPKEEKTSCRKANESWPKDESWSDNTSSSDGRYPVTFPSILRDNPNVP